MPGERKRRANEVTNFYEICEALSNVTGASLHVNMLPWFPNTVRASFKKLFNKKIRVSISILLKKVETLGGE